MKIVRYNTPESAAVQVGLDLGGEIAPVTDALVERGLDGQEAIVWLLALDPDEAEILKAAANRGPKHESGSVRFRCPLPSPSKVLAVAGGYYGSDAARLPDAATPYLFSKRADDVSGPGDPIVLWPIATSIVAEIEVALVIGRTADRIPVTTAMEHVGGYTICNDVSARGLALPPAGRRGADFDRYMDWLNGKWLDGFTILGPSLVTADDWTDNGDRHLTTEVSGEPTVTGSTADLNRSLAEIVSFASHLMTLHPGDVIATGMPHGPKPERELRDGDVVSGTVEGLGTLVNPVVAASAVAHNRPTDAP